MSCRVATPLRDDGNFNTECSFVEFRLTYHGMLPPSARCNQTEWKHRIRKVFHGQLKAFWEIHPTLQGSNRLLDRLALQYRRNGYSFVPLVTESLSLHCSLDILMLRPGKPGEVIKAGDIDNRLKTLFDALRMPANADELGGYATPEDGETPFYCLLEDDRLISRVSVETDVLLEPVGNPVDDRHVRLVLTVRVQPYAITMDSMSFG